MTALLTALEHFAARIRLAPAGSGTATDCGTGLEMLARKKPR